MSSELPLGEPVDGWSPRQRPSQEPMLGRWCQLEPLADPHADALYRHHSTDPEGRVWAYLPYGPFDRSGFRTWVGEVAPGDDPMFFAVIDLVSGDAVGVASFLRIDEANGVVEVGHINYSPTLQRTVAATEAMYLMMRRVFDELGYRRYEWKCHALNAASRAAAERLGFCYEGTHRQVRIVKGRNRDTAWYSMLDNEWPDRREALETWLRPDNFDSTGRQRSALRRNM